MFLGGDILAAGIGMVTLTSLTTFVYIADRIDVSEEDRINNPRRTRLVTRYRMQLIGIALLSLTLFELSLAVSLFEPTVRGLARIALGHVPLLVLAVYDDIKNLSMPLDTVAVALVWAYEIVFIYVFISPLSVGILDGLVLFTCWFAIVFAGLESRNMKDIDGDREAGKVTFAVILGRRRTKILEIVLKGAGGLALGLVSGNVFVLALVLLHLHSLQLYSLLETDFRQASDGITAAKA